MFTRKSALLIICLVYFNCLYGANYTVTNTNDNGAGSLRDAITQANTGSGNTISFNIPGGSPYRINLNSALPVITKPMTIDGNTQTGVTPGFPKVIISGAPWESLKLDAGSDGTTIRGLVLTNNNGCGIQIMNSNDHVIEGNYIGTNETGNQTGQGNGLHGIQVVNGKNITIGGSTPAQRNVIVGAKNNFQSGISIETNSNVKVIGNYIGIGANGTTAISNALNGIHIQSGSSAVIGGSNTGEGNVISGQSNGSGIFIEKAAANGVVITGNYIGTNASGTSALPNAHNGVTVEGTLGVTIGGITAGSGNVISGNTQSGVSVRAGSDNSKVQGNIIGLDKTGTTLLSNKENGVQAKDATSLLIQNNVITGNSKSGIALTNNNNSVIKGNIVGLRADGISTIANGTDPWGGPATGNGNTGIYIEASSGVTIGGLAAGEGNVVSGNTFWGIGLQTDQTNGSPTFGKGNPNVKIIGNLIGTDKTGNLDKGNNWDGVFANNSDGATIQNNVISGNTGRGIFLENSSGNATIKGNLIGTDLLGTKGIGNGQAGIRLVDSDNTIIGGTGLTDKNVVSDNKYSGIEISSTNNITIHGNNIGTDITGTTVIGNSDAGIAIFDNDKAKDVGSTNITVGGIGAGEGNIIANSNNSNNGGVNNRSDNQKNGTKGQGIFIKDPNSRAISIRGNSFFCNVDKGIDINGVANTNIPAPVIDPKSTRNNYFGTAKANSTVDIYEGDNCYSCGDAQQRQQGKKYLATVTADGTGKWTYSNANSTNLVAAVTDASKNTSQFSVAPIPIPTTQNGSICGNKTYSVTGATSKGNPYWQTSGDGTFSRTDTIAPKYTPGANDQSNGSVTLTLIDSAFCNAAIKTMTLTVNKSDIANFTIADYCVGTTSTPVKVAGASNGSFSLTSLKGSGNATMANVNTGTVSGGAGNDTLEVKYTTTGVCPAIWKDTVTVIPGGIANFTIADFCAGSLSKAPVFSTPPPTPGTYTISPATATIDNNGIIAGGVSGTTYNVTYNFTAGCNVTGSTTVTVKPLPTVSVSPKTICQGETVRLDASGTATKYVWSPDSTLLSAAIGSSVDAKPSDNETYKIVATLNNCADSTTATVTVNKKPVVTVATTEIMLCSGSSTTLTANGTADSYSWSGGTLGANTGSNVTVTPSTNTQYTLTATTKGCSNSTTLWVKVNPLPDPTITPGNSNICVGGQATLSLTSTFASYSWTSNPVDNSISSSTNQSITVSPTANSTVYTVEVTDTNGCKKSSSAVVNVRTTPVVYVTPNRTICLGDTVRITASGASTYSWVPNDGSLNVNTGAVVIAKPSQTTKYTVTGSTPGCSGNPTAEVTVTVNPLPTVAVRDTFVCQGASLSITATSPTAVSYTWSPTTIPSTGSTVSVNPAITTPYTVRVEDANKCTKTALLMVTVNQLPIIVSSGTPLCLGDSATLSASGADTYSWTPSNSLNTSSGASVLAKPAITTTYMITGTNTTTNCTNTKNVTVTVLPKVSADAGLDVTICPHESTTLTASGGSSYLWSTGANTDRITVSPKVSTTYFVIVSNGACSSIDTVRVFLKNENTSSVYIPNAFTPNGDNRNDVFMVKSEGVTEFEGMIFNRWGELYYQWNTIEEGWDGTFQGKLVQEDVYIYKINSKWDCNKVDERVGVITLMK